ncbi:ester cyclase [Paenibacillus tyrfis]|uniref:ester cyclase n=1 Tax=Paenibacillus tyrfis TaxID=1501230 RepID=UPI0028527AE5|nr:ester cyclase [Paenibacillus tyrfis]
MNTLEQTNIELVKTFISAFWNGNDAGLAETLLADDYVDHAYVPHTAEGLKQMAAQLRSAFPDQQSAIQEIVAQGDKVIVRLKLQGTHGGDFRGNPATGRPVDVAIYREYRLADGKIAEHWALFDTAALFIQIGAQLTPDQACKIR